MVLKQGNLTLKPGPDGYSFQIMPNDGHIEFYADDVARVKRVVSKPHTEIEIVTDLPAPNLPGMGLRTNEYVQNLNSTSLPYSQIVVEFLLTHAQCLLPRLLAPLKPNSALLAAERSLWLERGSACSAVASYFENSRIFA